MLVYPDYELMNEFSFRPCKVNKFAFPRWRSSVRVLVSHTSPLLVYLELNVRETE